VVERNIEVDDDAFGFIAADELNHASPPCSPCQRRRKRVTTLLATPPP